MNILVSGSHGLIGSALLPLLASRGHRIVRLVRSPAAPAADQMEWDPTAAAIDPRRLEGLDAVIHLAGASLAAGRWTPARKVQIRDSRIRSTTVLAEALALAASRPQVLICASAVGYYGNRGDEVLVEQSTPGTGFLADLCREWEAAADPAQRAGIRVVHLRTAVVLSPSGGVLGRVLPLFRAGLGGRLGSGHQYLSWIALDDEIEAIHHALTHDSLRGAVNFASPHPVTNREFTETLGRVLRRPTPFAVPAGVLRLALGELADEVLSSARAKPARLVASGYTFRYPELEGALRRLL